jgi:hypothetical protein
VNGITAWMYWLGWFPVAPLNMILASFYIATASAEHDVGFTPINTFIAWWTLGIAGRRHPLFFIPRTWDPHRRRLRHACSASLDGAADVHRGRLDLQRQRRLGQLSHFTQLDGTGFFTSSAATAGSWCTWATASCSRGT